VLETLNWTLALLPVLAMLTMFVWLDVFKLMTKWEMLGLLLLGGIAAGITYPVSGVFLDTLPLGYSNYSRFAAPWIEEAIKGLMILLLFRFNRIGFKLDAVISGFAIGAGFSVIENIIYLTRFPDLASGVWMVRGLGTAVMHGTTAAIMAAIAHELAERETRGAASDFDFRWYLWLVPGYIVASLIHMAFNQYPATPLIAMLVTLVIAPFLIMGLFKIGAHEAQQWLAQESAIHRVALAAWRSGNYPDDTSGKKIAALVARSSTETGANIRQYCETLTALVLAAEMALHQQAGREEEVEVDAAAELDRLDKLESALGRTTLSALRQILPFSRNDYWELSELRERLKMPQRGMRSR
jgi:RsiW-degrading membrane proteinase PrsW (M82 family)